jgi:hypothetical protein
MKVFLLFLVLASAELWVVDYEQFHDSFFRIPVHKYRTFESKESALSWVNNHDGEGFKLVELYDCTNVIQGHVVDLKKCVTE